MAQGSRGGLNTIAMIVAFVTIAGFLYWLSITAVPTEPVVAVEEEAAQAVSLAAFSRDPGMYEDVLIRVDGVEVVSQLSPGAFLVALADGGVYPVQLSAAAAGGAAMAPGSTGSITGRVETLPPETLGAWAADSVFGDEAQMEAVATAGTYLLAEEVDLAAAAPEEDGA
jgi:hypothetical protein